MRTYESTFILSPQADDAAFDQQIKAITDLIGNNDGKIIKEDRWGIRRMAYPIKKFTQGFYTRLVFEGNSKLLTELERFYKLEDPYIRYLTIIFEGDPHEKIFDDADSDSNRAPHAKPTEDRERPAPARATTESRKPDNIAPVAIVEKPSTETAVSEPDGKDEPEKTEE